MSEFATIPVIKYVIGDDDENVHEADNNRDFNDTVYLLERLREENPMTNYIMYTEIDA